MLKLFIRDWYSSHWYRSTFSLCHFCNSFISQKIALLQKDTCVKLLILHALKASLTNRSVRSTGCFEELLQLSRLSAHLVNSDVDSATAAVHDHVTTAFNNTHNIVYSYFVRTSPRWQHLTVLNLLLYDFLDGPTPVSFSFISVFWLKKIQTRIFGAAGKSADH